MPVANSIHHSNHIYNYFKSLKLGLILSDVYHNHLMTIMVSIFLCGYRGKTIDFAEVSCQHRTTTASHTKPSSQALHPIEAAYFHQSHLKGCQDYGHQVVSVMLSCNGIILNYAVILYDRSKSKIRHTAHFFAFIRWNSAVSSSLSCGNTAVRNHLHNRE